MELAYKFAQDGTISNVHFEGLDGCEPVRSVKEALDLMRIVNPAVAFAEDTRAGRYNDVSDEDYKLMLDAVKCVSSLWQYQGAMPDKKKEFQMNPLMLLANAVELLSQLDALLRERKEANKC